MDDTLLFSVFIFLGAACILAPLSKLSGLGSVIGYLLAGVIIGPSLLGLIDDPETILHFSEFGVVMMLFLIGLELKPQKLWELRGKLLGLGGLQVTLTFALIALAALALGQAVSDAIVIGMALALSSTAIALQTMQDRAMMGGNIGQSGFSVLLFQDVIVIAMIAALPLIATLAPDYGADLPSYIDHGSDGDHGANHNTSHSGIARPEGVWLAASVLGVFGGMILAGRLLLRPVFRIIARSKVRETFTALALLLVVGATLLMNWLGLSAALGAFIAGVVLADSEYRHQMERDIEPFKALLLGLFFMSVGMSLNIAMVASAPLTMLGLVLGLIAVKAGVLFCIGWIFKLNLSGRILFAVLLCQAGEFGFVLFQFALTEGAVAPKTVSLMNTVIALSMALTPILLLVYDRVLAPRMVAPRTTGEGPVDEGASVLILGFGRVGQIAARLLMTQDAHLTIIDNDGDHIEFVKQFDHRVFYGDASDVDLLRSAGADTADVIILAIDDVEAAVEAAQEIKHHFPKARLVARARNRTHMFRLLEAKVDFAERETVRGALAMGRKALEFLGTTPETAQTLSDDFLALDFAMIEDSLAHKDDMPKLIEKSKAARVFMRQTLGMTTPSHGGSDGLETRDNKNKT